MRSELGSGDGSRLDHLAVRWSEPVEVVFDHLAQAPRQIDIRPALCGRVEQSAEEQRVSPRAVVQCLNRVGRRRIGSLSLDQLGGRLQGQRLQPDVMASLRSSSDTVAEQRLAPVKVGVPVRAEDQKRCWPSTAPHCGDQVKGWPVGPVQIIDGEDERTIARRGQRVEQVERLSEHPFRGRTKCPIDQRGSMIDIDQRRQLQQPSRRHRVETTQHLRGRWPLCKIKYRLKYRSVGLTGTDGMALSDAQQVDGPVELG